MLTRRDFLEGSVIAGGLAFAASNSARAQGRARFQDKLTDDAGKYAVAPLPYGYDALEPAIDARTVELHYNNHHTTSRSATRRRTHSDGGTLEAQESGIGLYAA
jgi:Fe-Mn family superoxide dismutase